MRILPLHGISDIINCRLDVTYLKPCVATLATKKLQDWGQFLIEQADIKFNDGRI